MAVRGLRLLLVAVLLSLSFSTAQAQTEGPSDKVPAPAVQKATGWDALLRAWTEQFIVALANAFGVSIGAPAVEPSSPAEGMAPGSMGVLSTGDEKSAGDGPKGAKPPNRKGHKGELPASSPTEGESLIGPGAGPQEGVAPGEN